MLDRVYSNNAKTALTNNILAADLTIVVNDSSLFSSPSAGQVEVITITDGTNIEIVHCANNNIATSTLTVIRGQEGTTAFDFIADTTIYSSLTKSNLDEFRDQINLNTANIATNASDSLNNSNDILTNANNIATNTADILTNANNIASYSELIDSILIVNNNVLTQDGFVLTTN